MTMVLDDLHTQRPPTAKPLYAQVRDLLLERVKRGEWTAGETLPNEFVLANTFRVSIGTVRRAVAELENSGVLVRKQGRGTYVAGDGPLVLQEKFPGLVAPDGKRPEIGYELAGLSTRPATSTEAAALKVAPGDPLIELTQHATLADRTIGVEISWLSARRFPRLDTQMRYGQHLYPVLADYGCLVTRVEEVVGITTSEPSVAARLALEPNTALLRVERTTFCLDNEPIELRRSLYVADRFSWGSR